MIEHASAHASCYRFPDSRLLIFAKAPIPGRVKTRLAGRLGSHSAAHIYKQLLYQTVTIACSTRLSPVELWCAPDTRHCFFTACRQHFGVRLRRQCMGDLGQRMNHALNQVLAKHRYALLIGGDCMSLGTAELQQAFEYLDTGNDVVLGPAMDGGYVLVGLRRPSPMLFRGIAWGTPTVLAATRQRLQRAALSSAELPLGWDVDTPADLQRWRRA